MGYSGQYWQRVLLLLLCLASSLWAQPSAREARIGILFFQDDQDPLGRLKATAATLAEADPPLKASFAIGTYGELRQWMEDDLLDIAVLSPGLVAELSTDDWEILGSGVVRDPDENRSVWLARRDSGLKSIEALKKAGSSLEILGVHPLSVSGFLTPVHALRESGLEVQPGQVRFSHSHSNSLKALVAGEGPQIACVWKPTWKQADLPGLEIVPLPAGDIVTPPMAIVGRRGSGISAALKGLIQEGKFPDFEATAGYADQLRNVPPPPDWAPRASLSRVGLGDLVLTLRHYNRTHPTPARLAVVLTGGGAKCAYQAGAVRALEEALEEGRARYQDPNLDIALVVGTSGGAINALAVAMELTSSEEGFQELRGAWLDLDQREIVSPPPLVRLNMWCWFASIFGLALLAITRWRKMPRTRGLLLTAVCGLVLALVPRLPLAYSHWLGGSSELQHVWTWLSFGIEGAGFVLMGAALLWEGLSRRAARRGTEFHPRVPVGRTLTLFVAVLPLLQAWTILMHEEVISENRGLESALTRNFSALIRSESKRRGEAVSEGADQASIAELSRAVFAKALLRRDLVLTASPLTEPGLDLPAEFYFYASHQDQVEPSFGARGVSLKARPELLFDAMLGSAAIYPLFPARPIKDLPEPGVTVNLVDGSFAHRSPLEAAVDWGATHVLIIEASTQEVAVRGKLLHNFGAALAFLYDQAQQVDVRLKGETALYTLYPSSPHIGLLDFSAPLLEAALEKGYREAAGSPSRAEARGGALHKEIGAPAFWAP